MKVGTAISVTIVRIAISFFMILLQGGCASRQRPYEVNVSRKLDAGFHKLCALSTRVAAPSRQDHYLVAYSERLIGHLGAAAAAALRDFDPADVRFGLFTSDQHARPAAANSREKYIAGIVLRLQAPQSDRDD